MQYNGMCLAKRYKMLSFPKSKTGQKPSQTVLDVCSMLITFLQEVTCARLKDVRAKIFCSIDFFKHLLQITCFRNQLKIGGHWLRFRDKACGKLV